MVDLPKVLQHSWCVGCRRGPADRNCSDKINTHRQAYKKDRKLSKKDIENQLNDYLCNGEMDVDE